MLVGMVRGFGARYCGACFGFVMKILRLMSRGWLVEGV